MKFTDRLLHETSLVRNQHGHKTSRLGGLD